MRRAIVDLPLHYGKAPRWLFEKMSRLSRAIVEVLVYEYGPDEILRRISDPYWFQALGCMLGFDWHSSGLTTTVCGALKESIKGLEKDLGFYIAGGKGKVARKTPQEIENYSLISNSLNPLPLIYASRMSAKVDSTALQDGYQIYHHCFFFTNKGKWAVVQQGLNENTHYARRYHWLSEEVNDFVIEPHKVICAEHKEKVVLNLVAKESEETRKVSTELACQKPEKIIKDLKKIVYYRLPREHEIFLKDINPERLNKIFLKTYKTQPENYESLLGLEGVGPKTIRALALISELLYGTKLSYNDPVCTMMVHTPVRYSFAHGGKDGHPYPVDKKVYENSISFLQRAIEKAKLGDREKLDCLRRLR